MPKNDKVHYCHSCKRKHATDLRTSALCPHCQSRRVILWTIMKGV